jgi:hypothetical protein
VRPPFETPAQALRFAAGLAFLVALPALMAARGLPPRENVYGATSLDYGPYSYIQKAIFAEKGDVDLAIIGDSATLTGFDDLLLRDALSAALHRPATVVNLSVVWRQEDYLYYALRDLAAHRRVHHVLINPPKTRWLDGPHPLAYRWIRYGSDWEPARGLSLQSKIALYGEATLGAPRHLLSLLRPDEAAATPASSDTLGGEAWTKNANRAIPFAPFHPPPPSLEPGEMIVDASGGPRVTIEGAPLPEYSAHFLDETVKLARRSGVPLTFVELPHIEEARLDAAVTEEDWRALYPDVPLVAPRPRDVFTGLSDADLARIFYNRDHFNPNGATYYTAAILPAILHIHAQIAP